MRDGAALYELVRTLMNVNIVVYDSSSDRRFFKGNLDFEGCDFDKETGKYSFRALESIKSFWSKWSAQDAGVYGPYWVMPVLKDDEEVTPGYWVSSENINSLLKRILGIDVIVSDYEQSRYQITLTDTTAVPLGKYKVSDLILDCAAHLNAAFYIDGQGRLAFQKLHSPSAVRVVVESSKICSFRTHLKHEDYIGVFYSFEGGSKTVPNNGY